MSKPKAESFNFEKALAELTDIVENMERGDLALEDSLKSFERGVKLTRQCQKALKEAEQRVKILTEKNQLVDFKINEN